MTWARSPWLPGPICEAVMKRAFADFLLFERLIEAIYTAVLSSKDTCLDGGANRGIHTLPMAARVPEGRVIAVEALPDLAEELRRVTDVLPQVKVVEAALANAPGNATFHRVHDDPARSGLQKNDYPGEYQVSEIQVPCVRTDDLFDEATPLRFAKLDLEGGEYHALCGGRDAVNSHNPMLVFERSTIVYEQYGYTPNEFMRLFAELDYLIVDLFGQPIIEEEWFRYNRPWYAIAAKAGSNDAEFVKEGGLGLLLKNFVESELSNA